MDVPLVVYIFGPIVFYLRDVFFEEINANRLFVISCKNALTVALDHTWLAHRSIANNHHLKIKRKKLVKIVKMFLIQLWTVVLSEKIFWTEFRLPLK